MKQQCLAVRIAGIIVLALGLLCSPAFGDDSAESNQNYPDVLLFIMEGSTTLNQFGLPATAPAGDPNGPSLVTTRYDLVQAFWMNEIGMSLEEVASFQGEMRDFMLTEWGLEVQEFDPNIGVASVLNSNGVPVGVALAQYVKPEMNYRPYWIQGIPKPRLRDAETFDIGFVVALLQDTVASGEQSGVSLLAGAAIAYGRYVIRGIPGKDVMLITFFSSRPILPNTTHLECELISDEFGAGQALLVNPASLAEELDPTTHETRFLTRNTLTFPRRLE